MRKKREVAERARQKKLEEERRKEEERQRKQDEEDERQDRRREEQRQKEDEKRSREEEKRRRDDERRRQEEERKAAKRQAEEDRRQAKKQQQQLSARRTAASDYDDERISPVRRPNAHDTFRAGSDNAPPIDEKPVAAAGNDASFYMQAAASSDAKGSVGSLLPCRQCGRKFAQDRLKKHQDACVKANKPRKEFNAAMKRVEGTEMAKYAGKNRKPDPPVSGGLPYLLSVKPVSLSLSMSVSMYVYLSPSPFPLFAHLRSLFNCVFSFSLKYLSVSLTAHDLL